MIWAAKFNIWPPSVNAIWRKVGKRTLLSASGRKFYDTMDNLIRIERSCWHLPTEPINGDIRVEIKFTPPTLARRDADNFVKGIFDAMTKAKVWHDDSQVQRFTVEMSRWKTPGGLVEIWIEEPDRE